jgi:ubiquinone/menaquinone biosynthesis C-methylase UbiE
MKKNIEVWENQIPEWNTLIYPPESIDSLLKVIKKTDKILDQGCGIGQYSFTVYKLGYKNVTGMDFSPKLIKSAKENSKKLRCTINFIEGDIRDMPFKEDTFDAVISAGIVEHVPETEKTIQELRRVLKRDGYLFIHVPHKISTFTLIKKIRQFLGLWNLGYEKSFTIKEFKGLLKKNNFEILDFYINEFNSGKHKFIGGILRLMDKPLYHLGYGGHHLHFLCKNKKIANTI